MIQRAQTLFLLGAIILQITLFFIPFWKGKATVDYNGQTKSAAASLSIHNLSENYRGQIDSVGDSKNLYVFQCFDAVIIFLSGWCIFLFRKRTQQIRISRLLILLTTGFVILLLYYTEEARKSFADDASNLQKIGTNFQMINNNYDLGIYLPIVSLVLFFLAGRYIKKDEKLVRSADRLR